MNESQQHFSLDAFLPYQLMKVAAHVSDSLAEVYEKDFGLSRAEWRIVASLGSGENLNAKSLVEDTRMDKVKVSRTLALLESKSLIVREKNQHDMRTTSLSLTEKGAELYDELLPKVLAWEQGILSGIPREHYDGFILTLELLLAKSQVNPKRALKDP